MNLLLLMSFTADDEHCICVRNIQLNNFISVHCQLKGFIPILNCFTFVMERQCGLRSYLPPKYSTFTETFKSIQIFSSVPL